MTVGFFSGLLVTSWLAGRYEKIEKRVVWDFTVTMILVALIGSKLFLVLTEPVYLSNPSFIFTIEFLRSAGVFYGGFLFAAIYSFWYFRKFRLPGWKMADAFGPGLALGHMFGRLGCFAAGCCHGSETHSGWGMTFSDPQCQVANALLGKPLWPTQLFEVVFNLALFVVLFVFYRKKTFDGQVILLYAMGYSVFRFLVEFLRGDERGAVLYNISTSQFIALVVFPVALFFYVRCRKASKTT